MISIHLGLRNPFLSKTVWPHDVYYRYIPQPGCEVEIQLSKNPDVLADIGVEYETRYGHLWFSLGLFGYILYVSFYFKEHIHEDNDENRN